MARKKKSRKNIKAYITEGTPPGQSAVKEASSRSRSKPGQDALSLNGAVLPPLRLSRAERYYSVLVFVVLGILVFYPPYYRGLFFNEDMFLYHTLTGLVFILVWIEKISRKDFTFIKTPLDWAILAYAGAYLLSLIGAVHSGEALYGFLKALNYFMVYWMVSQVLRDYRRYEDMLRIILASGLGVALIGILAAVGISDYPSAFDANSLRILSTLQYPNTTAAFLAVISLLGVTLWIREESPWLKLIYSTSIYLLILVVLAAFSKGAWVIFALGALLLLAGMPGIYRLKSLYILGAASLAALAAYSKFIPALPAASGLEPGIALQKLFLGFIIVLAGQAAWDLGIMLRRKRGNQALATYAGALLLLLVLLLFRFPEIPQAAQQIFPENLSQRISQIKDTSGHSYSSRMDFARWGLAIMKDYPLFGAGAGGWNALYHQYQEYQSWTTETHNHFVQVGVEAGALGLLAFISLWLGLFLALWRIYRARQGTNNDTWILNWGVASAALAFGLHAAMDFDLSLGAMSILLWTLLALLNAGSRLETGGEERPRGRFEPALNICLAILLAAAIIGAGSSFSMAYSYAREGEALLGEISADQQLRGKEASLHQARSLLERASYSDPYNANYHAALAQAYALQFATAAQAQNPAAREYYEAARQEIKRAGELSPYSIKLRTALANLCLGLNDPEGAVEQAYWSIRSNPNDIDAYEGALQLSFQLLDNHLQNQRKENAAFYANEIVELGQKLQAHRESIDPVKRAYPYWAGKTLELSPAARFTLGKAHYLLGQYAAAREIVEQLLPLVRDGSFAAPEAEAWYLAVLYRAGEEELAAARAFELTGGDTHLAELYRYLLSLDELPAKGAAE